MPSTFGSLISLMRTVAIVQARVNSSRLPGKVLKLLGKKTILHTVLERLRVAEAIDDVCCATSTSPADDPIVSEAKNLGFLVFRGEHEDVLDRHLNAARYTDADVVVRVTSDCPCVDPKIVNSIIRLREEKSVGYASNNMPRSWPIGMDVEVFENRALELAARFAVKQEEREHVSPWMRVSPLISRTNLESKNKLFSDMRLTVDYPEDYEFFKLLIKYSPNHEIPFDFSEIADVIESNERLSTYFRESKIFDVKYEFGSLNH